MGAGEKTKEVLMGLHEAVFQFEEKAVKWAKATLTEYIPTKVVASSS